MSKKPDCDCCPAHKSKHIYEFPQKAVQRIPDCCNGFADPGGRAHNIPKGCNTKTLGQRYSKYLSCTYRSPNGDPLKPSKCCK